LGSERLLHKIVDASLPRPSLIVNEINSSSKFLSLIYMIMRIIPASSKRRGGRKKSYVQIVVGLGISSLYVESPSVTWIHVIRN
jgi:hypothetical protein